MADTRPPAPPNGCQKYHGIPGCRCQARASKDQQHHGAHHCNEHDRYWTDREEMYVEMYVEIAAKWAALLEHADLAEDVQPEEVIDALSVRCNRRAEDHECAATPAPLDQQTTTTDDDAWLTGKTQTRQVPDWASEGYHHTERPERDATPAPLDVMTPCLFVPPHEPFYCRIHADVRLRLTDERCRRAATPAPLDDPVIAAMRPARRGGYRRLTFDNGRYETYDCVFISTPTASGTAS